ncbi:uncharacterized protein LOC102809299, partial [Saccoglossus kowalevskii]
FTKEELKTKCHPRQWIHVISSHVGLVLLFFTYVVIGAFIFQTIEAPRERQERQRLTEMRQVLVKTLWGISATNQTNGTVLIQYYLGEWEEAILNSRISLSENEHHWTFTGAVFFSSATITTIGYGNIAPVTTIGRILCICYAFMGIPITLLVLSDVGGLLARWGKIAAIIVTRKIEKRKERRKERGNRRMPTIMVEDLGNKMTKERYPSKYSVVPNDVTDSRDEKMAGSSYDDVPRRDVSRGPDIRQMNDTVLSARVWDRLMKSSVTSDISRSEPDLRSDRDAQITAMKLNMNNPQGTRDVIEKDADSNSTVNESYCGSRRPSGQFLEVVDRNAIGESQDNISESSKSSQRTNVILVPEPIAQNQKRITMSRGKKSDVIVANESTGKSGVKESEIATFHFPIWLAIVILIIYLCLGGFVFSLIENWSFFESFYFCFISLSTIGFGDVIPENKGTILTLSIAYAILGLALTSMCISLASTAILNSLSRLGQLTEYYKTRQWKNVKVYRSLYVRGRSLRRRFSSRRRGRAGQFAASKRTPKRGSSLRLPGKFAIVRMETPSSSPQL